MKIAIVGMAFRFPGDICTESSFWEVLKNSRDVVTEVPPERWGTELYQHPKRSEPGRSITFSAGVLSKIDEFDAAFFGISPREANQMDPQQRLLLEMAWEALENGGQVPADLAGTDCAVYIGISNFDYGHRFLDDPSSINAYSMTGNTLSIAANRISYMFDLHGPSMAIDTACSSSLVALHQACQSLRNGEASMAIAGGVNLLLHPYPFIGFTKASMLSDNGLCKTFDADGKGYVRAEGGAVLLLKSYDQAINDGDPIHAVILGSGVNTDGNKSGITIPSASAQASLMKNVCKQADINPEDIDYIEAHGTGTTVGDPIEIAAIGNAIGKSRKAEHPLFVGSVKSNMGHLEPASGMAGLVKTVLCLKHHALPASLHLEQPNPHIDFSGLHIKPVTEYTPLPEKSSPLRMGINSFGFGGANAHVLLEEHSAGKAENKSRFPFTESADESLPFPPVFISARDPNALKELATRYSTRIAQAAPGEYYDIAHTAAFRRQRMEYQAAIFGASSQAIEERLRVFSHGGFSEGIVEENSLTERAKLAFVYSGNGAQWVGMGRELLEEVPIFRKTIEEIDALLTPLAGISIMDELTCNPEQSKLHLSEIVQPALFAVQVGITRLLRAQGLDADAAVGHSVGEVAAAWAAGSLTLEQAVLVIHERSAAQGMTKGCGRMAAVGMSPERIQELLIKVGLAGRVEIAGINSPASVTLSGSFDDLEDLKRTLEPTAVFYRLLDLDYAFHSRHMDPIRDRVLRDLNDLRPSNGQGRFVSTVTGEELDGTNLTADYWWRNIREPVQFGKGITSLIKEGYNVFLEIGPHAILQHYIGECLKASKSQGRSVPSLKRNDNSLNRLLEAVYRVHLMGCPLDLNKLFPYKGNFVPLPNYPWQRERHWYSVSSEGYDLVNRERVHPLLGYRLKDGDAVWENQIDPRILPYLRDHVVGGSMVMPATAYVEMALAASLQHFASSTHEIEELEILIPILLDEEHARTVRFELDSSDGRFQIKSRVRLSVDEWTINAVGRLIGATMSNPPATLPVVKPNNASEFDAQTHYRLFNEIGLDYGPAFQGFEQAWLAEDDLLASIRLPEATSDGFEKHILHPVLLDSCWQTLLAFFHDELTAGQRAALLPVRVGRLQLFGDGSQIRYGKTHIVKRSPHSVLADFQLLDEEGNTIARLEDCRFRGSPISLRGNGKTAEWVYTPYLKPRRDSEAPALPSTGDIKAHAVEALKKDEVAQLRANHFQRIAPLFDALVGSFAYRACRKFADQEGWFSTELLNSLGENEELPNQFLRQLLVFLEEDGLIKQHDDGWKFTGEAEISPKDIWLTILGENSSYLPDLALAGHVGNQMEYLLSGGKNAKTFASALQSSSLMEQLLESSPTYQGINLAIKEAIAHALENWPSNRRLRLLEISRGSRAFTRMLLPLLPADQYDYVVAESDDDNLARAKAEFADHPQINCVRLNPDTLTLDNWETDSHGFDIILTEHVVHSASNIPLALTELKQVLNIGGLLLMLERHADRLADFTFGLNKDWWSPFGSRLLSLSDWKQLLEEANYSEIDTIFEPHGNTLNYGAFAILAKNPDPPLESVLPIPQPESWLLVADDTGATHGFAQSLKNFLEQHDQTVSIAANVSFPPDMDTYDHVVQLAGLSLQDDDRNIDLMEVQDKRCITTLNLVHAFEKSNTQAKARLWLVTGKGSVVSQIDGAPFPSKHVPSQSPLWGFGRVIMNEHPHLNCTLIDLQQDVLDEFTAAALGQELMFPDGEDEIILSSDNRYVTRMQRSRKIAAQAGKDFQNIRLDFNIPGQLRNLQWQTTALRDLADDEIEIRPMASGLNFRDVMYAMGLLSDEAVENGFAGPSMGLELSGVVTRVGPGVSEFNIGDPVIAFTAAGFSKRAITKAASTVRKPESWSFEEAATIPTAFFTAYYALHHLARLQPGEKVLIHGAAGAVGIAAIEVARYLGAEIFATAGNEMKRDFVRMLGADHVMDSRKLAFADEILEITKGEGVDVVLNSLAGEAINRNLRVLRPFGRFLELGKRDFYENTRIGLRPLKDNITYYGIDADQLMVERPALATSLFRELMDLFDQGIFRPLPYRTFSASSIVDAFRYMQQSKQIGKIVISFRDRQFPSVVNAPHSRQLSLSKKATYLVSGGLGGFGLRTARWLAEQGAGHIVLLSRRGAEATESNEAIKVLEGYGAKVYIKACDVADAVQIRQVIEQIVNEMPPLKGIVHAAMVLDDGLIRNLDQDRFNAVLRPKILGAWNLHQLTENLKLDLFVLYSSATTFIGNPGQANYVAANQYLEALAALRRSKGLAATSVSWGAIADVGYLARNEDVKEALQSRIGGAALTSDKALSQLGDMIANGQSGMALMDIDWKSLSHFLPATKTPRFDEMRRTLGKASANSGNDQDIMSLISNRTEDEVKAILQQLLVDEIAQILRLPSERIPPDRSLYDIGMDSLMGIELVLSIETRFGVNLPLMALSEGPTIERITDRLVSMLLHKDSHEDSDTSADNEELKKMMESIAAQHGVENTVDDLEEAVRDFKKEVFVSKGMAT